MMDEEKMMEGEVMEEEKMVVDEEVEKEVEMMIT